MGILSNIFRRRYTRSRAAPQTAGEAFWISLVKAIGRGIGGPFGKALTGPHHRRKQWWQK